MFLENQLSYCCLINETFSCKSIMYCLCWPLTFEELNFFLSSVGHFRILVVNRLYGSFASGRAWIVGTAPGRKMTATNNRMFERLDEIGYFHLNKFHKLSLQICVIWKYLHCMPSFVWISTKLDDTTLYHYEKTEYIEANCK